MALFGFDSSVVPDINFCVKDASIIESDVLNNYERFFFEFSRVAKKLGRADPVRLFLLTNTYQLVVQRSIVDSTGKMNLLKYSVDDFLDNIGARWGPTRGKRLPAQRAGTILRFSLSQIQAINVVIPYRQLAETYEGVQFRTLREAVIPAGELGVNVVAEAVLPGSQSNRIPIGEINSMVSWNTPYLVDVRNVIESSGGADRESNERYRARIWMAPESFSVAGPYGAYEFWGASANPNIIDIGVWGHADIAGQVWLYPLMEGGNLPSEIEKEQVLNICSDDDIRPLTDWVKVFDPIVVDHTVDITYFIDDKKAIFAESVRNACDTAYAEYLEWQRGEMGVDINFSKLTEFMMRGGAKRITPGHANPDNPSEWIDNQTRYVKLNRRQIGIPTENSRIWYGGLEPS